MRTRLALPRTAAIVLLVLAALRGGRPRLRDSWRAYLVNRRSASATGG